MKARPAGVDDREMYVALAGGWDIALESIDHLPVGFGSHHWIATDTARQRYFVTVDDLDHKGWLGERRDVAFAGLRRAFDVALALHTSGLRFVVAPMASAGGETARRLDARHSIAVFGYVDGVAGGFGDTTTAQQRADVVRLLARLHESTPEVQFAPKADLSLEGREGLEAALSETDRSWHGGPFAEPARALLTRHADALRRQLREFDGLVATVHATAGAPVITHGEPHPGNLMRTEDGLLLIDWDTVALAPPERDLWLVATESGAEAALYAELTGREVDAAAMSMYRLRWDLTDVAGYTALLRSSHQRTEDTEDSWRYLEATLRSFG